MKNDLPGASGIGGGVWRGSDPAWLSPGASRAASLLEEAADLLVVHLDFAAALDRCEKGCRSLPGEADGEDAGSSEELRCSLCIVGIQALAEMNRWREVLPWVLQYYQVPACLPPKVLELCILLHNKVKEPRVMLDVGSDWLRASANQHLPTYGLLVQLHLFHVLLPLGHFAEAQEMVEGCKALSKEQRLEACRILKEKRQLWLQQPEEPPDSEAQAEIAWKTQLGLVSKKVLTILAQLGRALGSLAGQFGSIPYKMALLAAFVLFLIVVKLDPASPTSLPFVYRLTRLFHQARSAVFSSHYRPPI
ncbi:peroxisome assembly protein 26 isoform X1 [Paroedura picta]|uniref:peroxisome assembly protein 26 isoform X1 n=1 Tax=Paroedura picta TaxID=143630 RepID=UPI0010146CDB